MAKLDVSRIMNPLSENDKKSVANTDRKIAYLSQTLDTASLVNFLCQEIDVALRTTQRDDFHQVGDNILILERLAENHMCAKQKLIALYHFIVREYNLPLEPLCKLANNEAAFLKSTPQMCLTFAYITKRLEPGCADVCDPEVLHAIDLYKRLLKNLSDIDLTETSLSATPAKLRDYVAKDDTLPFQVVNNLLVALFKFLFTANAVENFQDSIDACVDALYNALDLCQYEAEQAVCVFNLWQMMDVSGAINKEFFPEICAAHSMYDAAKTYYSLSRSQRTLWVQYFVTSQKSVPKEFILMKELVSTAGSQTEFI